MISFNSSIISYMYEFRQKKRLGRFLYSNMILAVLFIVLILIGKGVWNIYVKERSAMADRVDAERQIATLKERHTFLENEVNRLKTQNGIEREIREKFNVKKSEEEVAIIIDATTTEINEGKDSSFVGGVILWFKKLLD